MSEPNQIWVFPDPRLSIPEGWQCWKEPRHPTALDKVITELIKKKRSPRITKAQIGELPCPYLYARLGLEHIEWQVAESARRAQEAFDNRMTLRPVVGQVDEALRQAAVSLQRACTLLGIPDGEATLPKTDIVEHVAGIGSVSDLANVVSAARLFVHEGLIQTTLLGRKGKLRRYGKRSILAHAGRLYMRLTGSAPAAGDGPFPKFVEAVFDVLFPDRDPEDHRKLIRDLDWVLLKDHSEK